MDIPFAESALYGWTRRAAANDPVKPIGTLDHGQVKSIVLALTTGLGDAVLSSPVFSAVRKAFPSARITLFVRDAWAPLFSSDPDLDLVVPYFGKWRAFFATLKRLRDECPDLALILHGNDPDIIPLTYLAGARYVVRVPTRGTRYSWLLSNAGREVDRDTLPGVHYIDNRLRVLETMGIPAERRSPIIHPSPEAMAKADQWRNAVLGDQPYWILHPWAADAYKTWPRTQVLATLKAVAAKWPELKIVITGTNRERSMAESLASNLPSVVVAAGVFGIDSTAALLAKARAVVAPDTGLLHLAAALDVPTVGLFSPTSAALVGPRTERAPVRVIQQPLTCSPCLEKRCPYSEAKCMAQFGDQEVLKALEGVFAG
jgi:ADP-heptose:LPS heptosyltransferase